MIYLRNLVQIFIHSGAFSFRQPLPIVLRKPSQDSSGPKQTFPEYFMHNS